MLPLLPDAAVPKHTLFPPISQGFLPQNTAFAFAELDAKGRPSSDAPSINRTKW